MNTDRSMWRRVRFSEMAHSITERVDNPSSAGVNRYVGLEHLDSNSLTINRWGTPDQVEATKLRFRPGDVIFGRRRAYQRKVALADFDGICSAHALVLRAKPETLDPRFLPVFMQSETFFRRAIAISAGSLSPTINWKTLANQEFDVPPHDEQRRIADLLWSAEGVMRAARAAEEAAKSLERRVLEEAYADSTWPVRRVDGVGEVQLGLKREPKVRTGSFSKPYLRVANVGDDRLLLEDILQMDFNDSDVKRYVLRPGDILLNEGQSLELVGRCALYSGEIEDCCFQMTLLRFRSGGELTPEFAYGWFRRAFYRGDFAKVAKQTTSMAHLTAARFAAMPIPVPDKSIQHQVVERVDEARLARRSLEQMTPLHASVKRGLLDQILY